MRVSDIAIATALATAALVVGFRWCSHEDLDCTRPPEEMTWSELRACEENADDR